MRFVGWMLRLSPRRRKYVREIVVAGLGLALGLSVTALEFGVGWLIGQFIWR